VRFRELVEKEVTETLSSQDEARDEIDALLRALRT
jgi:hypothetical protein